MVFAPHHCTLLGPTPSLLALRIPQCVCHSSPVPQAMNIHLYSDKPWYGVWGVVHYCLGGPSDLLPADAVHVGHLLPAVRLGLGDAVIAGKNRNIIRLWF